MRKRIYVPMITLCLLLCGCGANGNDPISAETIQKRYREMEGCSMEATILCEQNGMEWAVTLQCDYVPGGESTVEILAPETISGIRAVFSDTDWRLEYEGDVLPIGPVSRESLSPANCLPVLMKGLQTGWLLEENPEEWDGQPCYRITTDQSGEEGKILSTVWVSQEDLTPLRGEISVEGEIILAAEFTSFSFYDTIEQQGA